MKEFLNKYDTIIFDLDGVITNENNYWNSAALTVIEVLNSDKYLGNSRVDIAEMSANTEKYRKEVFYDDALIRCFKNKGVNSNWDLGYVTVLISLIINSTDYSKIYEYAINLSDNILYEYDRLSRKAAEAGGFDAEYTERGGALWKQMHYCFQEWFLGDELYEKEYGEKPRVSGKYGLIHEERPVVDINELQPLLAELSKTKRLCTGTGRISSEMRSPLEGWGIIQYFSEDGLCNFSHVIDAEKRFSGKQFTKPHPYMFLKALYGLSYDDEKIINADYDKTKISRALVVGDAGADILAAKAMGADFCAVLTGVSGKSARKFFEDNKAEYILDSVLDMK